jgi:hypothetical protein
MRIMARARQRRALNEIERNLGAADPHLRGMFAIFATLTRDERPTGAEQLPRARLARQRLAGLVLLVPLLAIGLVAAFAGGSAPRRPPACQARAVSCSVQKPHYPERALVTAP